MIKNPSVILVNICASKQIKRLRTVYIFLYHKRKYSEYWRDENTEYTDLFSFDTQFDQFKPNHMLRCESNLKKFNNIQPLKKAYFVVLVFFTYTNGQKYKYELSNSV